MEFDRSTTRPAGTEDAADADLDTTDDGGDDESLDAAVLAADDTGMLSGERLITIAETEEATVPEAGDV